MLSWYRYPLGALIFRITHRASKVKLSTPYRHKYARRCNLILHIARRNTRYRVVQNMAGTTAGVEMMSLQPVAIYRLLLVDFQQLQGHGYKHTRANSQFLKERRLLSSDCMHCKMPWHYRIDQAQRVATRCTSLLTVKAQR
jgi:hypothetical protein